MVHFYRKIQPQSLIDLIIECLPKDSLPKNQKNELPIYDPKEKIDQNNLLLVFVVEDDTRTAFEILNTEIVEKYLSEKGGNLVFVFILAYFSSGVQPPLISKDSQINTLLSGFDLKTTQQRRKVIEGYITATSKGSRDYHFLVESEKSNLKKSILGVLNEFKNSRE